RLLTQQFEARQIQKTYQAVVRGFVQQNATIDYPLQEKQDKIADKFARTDKPAQQAITTYQVNRWLELPLPVGRYTTARYSHLTLFPYTGRKHQLRRHLKHIFHPIIGDTAYGDLHQNRA